MYILCIEYWMTPYLSNKGVARDMKIRAVLNTHVTLYCKEKQEIYFSLPTKSWFSPLEADREEKLKLGYRYVNRLKSCNICLSTFTPDTVFLWLGSFFVFGKKFNQQRNADFIAEIKCARAELVNRQMLSVCDTAMGVRHVQKWWKQECVWKKKLFERKFKQDYAILLK